MFNKWIGVAPHPPSIQHSSTVFILRVFLNVLSQEDTCLPLPQPTHTWYPLSHLSWSPVTLRSETLLGEIHIPKLSLGNYSLGEEHLMGWWWNFVIIVFFFFHGGYLYLKSLFCEDVWNITNVNKRIAFPVCRKKNSP